MLHLKTNCTVKVGTEIEHRDCNNVHQTNTKTKIFVTNRYSCNVKHVIKDDMVKTEDYEWLVWLENGEMRVYKKSRAHNQLQTIDKTYKLRIWLKYKNLAMKRFAAKLVPLVLTNKQNEC